AIARHKQIPLRFIGVGETLEDLQPFNAEEFVDALLD
ncbi:MAG: signal recognition particle-docking protein FtsY, partial [Betaproteobacteria bacterium]|nr:signal recognition particle-docking protein FtsY [Betaproteobacteria bacterium]